MWLLIIAVVLVILYIVIRPYCLKYDNIVCFTGAIGSGKSLNSTQTAVMLCKRQRMAIRWHNFFHPWHKLPLPMLYSNIPLRLTRKEYAIKLDEEHLLMQKRIVPRSVVFIDEIDQFANQLEWRNPNLARLSAKVGGNFDEFIRLFRHYTKGGYLVLNTQATDNIVTNIRRRMGTFVNLMQCRSWGIPIIAPNILYTCKCRHILISEDVTAVEEKNIEDGYSTLFGFFPLYRRYDTYCYSDRYEVVPYEDEKTWRKLKTNKMIICPNEAVPRTTKSEDDEE